jgi:ATP-dependent Lon protease
MEVIELNSYTLDEKNHIAFDHLLPQVVEEHGLKDVINISFEQETMKSLIELYTREAGVRQLKRELSGIARGIAREYVEKAENKKNSSQTVSKKAQKRQVVLEDLHKYLGPEIYLNKKRPHVLPLGVSTGLAWTPNGGDTLYIETAKILPGAGKFSLTGQLGDVMKESVQTAFSFIKSNAKLFGINIKDILKSDLHVHFPEGAVKKDGPSAGIAAFCALVSQFSGKPLSTDLAMTGEISLRGEVLPVGGVKEKLLAAHRYGIKQVMIPELNKRDLVDIPEEVLNDMKVILVSNLEEVYKIAFRKEKILSQTKKPSKVTKPSKVKKITKPSKVKKRAKK